MTVVDLGLIFATFKGGPRIVVQEECPPYKDRMALTIYCHRKHISRVGYKFPWEYVMPVGILYEFKAKSHKWLKDNSFGTTYSFYTAYAPLVENDR